MAELPNNLTRQDIYDLQDAAQRFYPEEIGKIKGGVPISRYLKWPNREAFDNDIFKYTGYQAKDIVKAYDQLGKWSTVAPVKTEQVESVPQNIKALTEESTKKEAERQKLIAESNRKVREQIASAQAARQKIQDSKPTIKVKVTPPPKPSAEIQSLVDQFKNNPSIPFIEQQLKQSVGTSLQGKIPEEEIDLIVKKAAYDAVDAATHPEKYIQLARDTAILNAVAKDNVILPKVISDSDVLQNVRVGANELGTMDGLQTQFSRTIWGAFNPELAKALFQDPGDYQIVLSQTEGNITFSPEGMLHGYSNFLGNNIEFLGKLAGLPVDQFKQQIMSKASIWLEGQIVSNFPQAATFFASPESQILLSSLGIGTTTIDISSALTYFSLDSTALPVLNFFSEGLGISFTAGGGSATGGLATAAAATGESVATTGGIMASEAFLGGAAVTAGGATTGAAAGAAAGTAVAPVVGTVIGAAVGIIGPKVVGAIKDNVQKYSKSIVVGMGALFGGGLALATGGVSVVYGALLGGGTALGIATFTSGGLPAIQAGLSGLGSGVIAFIDTLWATFLAGIGGPIIGFLLGFPVVVIFILFIINSGAYVVPPGELATASTNPYISVTKVPSPSGQLPSPTKITYTVTITAKKDSLTDITIKGECHAQTESGSLSCPKEDIPTGDQIPDAINAGSPFTFTFTSDYGNIFQDSLVSNSITVTANSPTGGEVTETGSASVCFGKCPLNCFKFPEAYWPSGTENYKQNLIAAVGTLGGGKYAPFAAKACANGTINVCYKTNFRNSAGPDCNGGSYGYNEGSATCDIDLNKCGISTPNNALYILTHETTHVIQNRPGGAHLQAVFDDYVPSSKYTVCTYSETNGSDSESMAEANSLYVANPTIYAPCSPPLNIANFPQRYPQHYNFANNCMYSSVCNAP